MTAMQPLFDIIFGLEGFEATAFWITLFVVYLMVGFFIDMLMEKQGFGPYFNAIFALVGTFLGLYVRFNYTKGYQIGAYEPFASIVAILAGVASFMIVLAFLRNRTS